MAVKKKVTKKKTTKTGRPVGRPTKYKPEFCGLVIEYMEKGLSKEAMAGVLRINKDTLYAWAAKYPEFSDALKEGVELSRLFWEQKGIDHLVHTKNSKQLNSTAWIFNMKNRFKWTDKKEIELGEETRATVKLNYNLDEDEENEEENK